MTRGARWSVSLVYLIIRTKHLALIDNLKILLLQPLSISRKHTNSIIDIMSSATAFKRLMQEYKGTRDRAPRLQSTPDSHIPFVTALCLSCHVQNSRQSRPKASLLVQCRRTTSSSGRRTSCRCCSREPACKPVAPLPRERVTNDEALCLSCLQGALLIRRTREVSSQRPSRSRTTIH